MLSCVSVFVSRSYLFLPSGVTGTIQANMRKLLTILLASCFLAVSTVAITTDVAEAARLGGAKSFGSHPSMSSPAKNPMQYNRQAQAPAAQPGAAAAKKGGLGFGGGLLGGLLAGSLLGSLFGGAGMGGGGGFLDIILLALIGFLIFSFIRKRKAGQQQAYQTAGQQQTWREPQQQNSQYAGQNTGSAWDSLRSDQGAQQAGMGTVTMQSNVPAGFDAEDFLKGAKMAYTRLQASWDRRDMEDISHFATAPVMQELYRQQAEDPNPGRTQIVMLNATLVNVEEFGGQDRAQVYFDALLIEDPQQTQPANARELWTFVRDHATGSWKLDGIQQIEGC